MNEPYYLGVTTLYGATILVTILCAAIGRSKWQPQQRRLAKLCRAFGLAVAIVGFFGTASGLLIAISIRTATYITESDRALVFNRGLAGAGYNFLFSFAISLTAFLVARRSSRQHGRATPGTVQAEAPQGMEGAAEVDFEK